MLKRNSIVTYVFKALLLIIIFSFFFHEIKNFNHDYYNKNYAIKISDIEYSFKYYKTALNKSIYEIQKNYDRKLSYLELLHLEKNVINILVNNTLVLLESRSIYTVEDKSILNKEFKKIKVLYKNNFVDKLYFYKMIHLYKISEQDFIHKVQDKIMRVLFLNSILLNNLLINGLSEIIINHDLQFKKLNIISIPFHLLNIVRNNNHLRQIYVYNNYLFDILEKRKVQYLVISSHLLKKNIQNVLKKRLKDNYIKNNFYFIKKSYLSFSIINYSSYKAAFRQTLDISNQKFNNIKKYLFYSSVIVNNSSHNYPFNIVDTPFGLTIIKVKENFFPHNFSKININNFFRENYVKQTFINHFCNDLIRLKHLINQNTNIKNLSNIYNISVKNVTLGYNMNQLSNFFYTKLFIKHSFSANKSYKNKVFFLADNRLCILSVKKVFYKNNIKVKDIKDIIATIFNRKCVTIRIFDNMSLKPKILLKTLDYIIMQNTEIICKNNVSFLLYKLLYKLKNDEVFLPIFNYNENKLYFLRVKNIFIPSNHNVEKYSRIYQMQTKRIERQIIIKDILNYSQQKFIVDINSLITSYIYKYSSN